MEPVFESAFAASVVKIHNTGWEPVLLMSPHYTMVWRLGFAMPVHKEALARARQELDAWMKGDQ